jgi:hypothetical protein
MKQYNQQEILIINKIIEILENDTEIAIDFLVDSFEHYRDDLDEMVSYQILELALKEISNADFETIQDATEFGEGFENIDFTINVDDITIANGTMRQPCKNPCPTCPYTKNALQGYFGGNDPSVYVDAIHQDTIIACHTRTKHDDETYLPNSEDDITICTGHIVTQIKTCKNSQHPDGSKAHKLVRSLDNFEKLKDNALGFDFKSHHNLV